MLPPQLDPSPPAVCTLLGLLGLAASSGRCVVGVTLLALPVPVDTHPHFKQNSIYLLKNMTE